MSAHEFVSRSGYVEDAYPDQTQEFYAFDTEGKRWPVISYGRTYVIESTVEEISRSRAIYTSYHSKGFPLKESETFNSYGRPQEVQDFLTKIFTEVNGPPHGTTDPYVDTNQGRHNFATDPPSVNSHPNVGRVHYSFPRKKEGLDLYGVDPKHGSSPTKVGSASIPNTKAIDPNRGYKTNNGYGSYPTKVEPVKDYGFDHNFISSLAKGERAPSHYWDRSSSPVRDRPHQGDYSAPYRNHQWGGYGVDSKTPRSSSPIHDRPPERNYPISKTQQAGPWKPHTRDYGVSDNLSPRKPSSPRDYEVRKDKWSGFPMNSQSPYEYEVHSDDFSKPENPVDYRDNRWGRSPLNPETQYYGGLDNKRGKPVFSAYYNPQKNPENQLGRSTMKLQIPENPSNRENLWGIPAVETQNPNRFGVPDNQWDKSSNPAHDHLLNNSSSPKNQWGSHPFKKQSPKDYEVPTKKWDSPLSPIYDHPQNNPSKNRWQGFSEEKQNPRGYEVPNNQSSSLVYDHPQNNPSSPKNPWGGRPSKTQSPIDYRVPSNQSDRSSSPVYGHPQNPPSTQWGDSTTDTKDPVRPKGSSNQWDKSSSPTYDRPQNPPNKQWGNSAMETTGPVGFRGSSNQWDRSSSPIFDPSANGGHHNPPEVTCNDGVCTLNDRPKAYDEAKAPRKPVSYSNDQYGNEKWQSGLDDQPKGIERSTHHIKPSGYNDMEGALKQLRLDAGGKSSAIPATSPSGSQKFTVAPPLAPRPEVAADNKEATRRFGGHNFPTKSMAGGEDQKRIISSKEAVERYNGSLVPK